jgi:methyl-accepting chemotaxis protein
MKNLSFRATTMLGFSAVVALFSAIIAFCIFELQQIQHGVAEIENDVVPYELLADEMAFDVVQVQQFLTDAAATHERDGFADAEKYAKSFKDGIKTLNGHYAVKPEKLKELKLLGTSFDAYYATGKRMAEAYITKGLDAGNEIMKQPQTGFDAAAEDLTQKMSVFRNAEVGAAGTKVREVDATALRATYLGIIVGLIGIVGALGLAWRLSGNLLAMIGIDPQHAKTYANEIANGDLSRDIVLNAGDNSSLLFAMRSMQIKLREVINEVSGNAKVIVQAAQHLATSSQTVLASSQRQNDAASGVATATEEMTASIGQIASNADHSDKVARQAGAISDQGGQVVSDAVEEMNKIAASVSHSSSIIRELGVNSQKISEIVNVIKDIADQTNLLALNAAIEAARAGEQGRGFAVVADEVRNLAARTSSATQEISGMVEDIQKSAANAVSSMEQGTDRVNEGVAKAQRAGTSMAQIKEGTVQVVETVAGITEALNEQSMAVNLVAREVEMIARMVSENTLAVDDLAKTSENLNQLANALHTSVSHFKV